MSDLAERIERLEAAEGVRELLWRYVTTVDGLGALDGLGDLFTEDAVLINPNRFDGRQAIVEYYTAALTGADSARHHVANSTITVEGTGRARHRGYFLAFMRRGDAELVVFGDYDDIAVRGEDGRWRFFEKGNHITGVTTLPAKPATEG